MAKPRHGTPQSNPPSEPETYNIALLRTGDGVEWEREWARVVDDLTDALAACLIADGLKDKWEDIVQETLLRAVRYLHTFKPEEATLRQWIFGIMENQKRTALRLLYTKPTHGDAGLDDIAAPGDSARQIEIRIDLEAAEARLTPKERQAWELHHKQGRTFPEAEAVTGQDQRALKVASHRAKRRLRGMLD